MARRCLTRATGWMGGPFTEIGKSEDRFGAFFVFTFYYFVGAWEVALM